MREENLVQPNPLPGNLETTLHISSRWVIWKRHFAVLGDLRGKKSLTLGDMKNPGALGALGVQSSTSHPGRAGVRGANA